VLFCYAWPAFGGALLWPHSNYYSDFKSTGLPITDRDTAALFILGLTGAILFWRRKYIFSALFIWWMCSLLLGSLLTRDAPYAPRILFSLGAGYLLAGWALSMIFRQVRQRVNRTISTFFLSLIILWCGIIASRNTSNYYTNFPDIQKNPVYRIVPTALMNFLRTFPPDAYLVLYTKGFYDQFGYASMDLFDTGFERKTFKDGKIIPPPHPQKPTAYVFHLPDFGDLDLKLRQKFPNVTPVDIMTPYLSTPVPQYRVYWVYPPTKSY
jgi:hypothetical protein